MQNFKIIRLDAQPSKSQVEQFVAMMQRMYDYHATLHDDWKTKTDWHKGSNGWISRAAGGDEYLFSMAYQVGPDGVVSSDRAAGYVIGSFHYEAPLFIRNRYGYIADLWVEEAYRKAGVARLMLEDAHEWFREQGVDRVQLEVDVENALGRHFWEKAGYQPFEIVMRKDI